MTRAAAGRSRRGRRGPGGRLRGTVTATEFRPRADTPAAAGPVPRGHHASSTQASVTTGTEPPADDSDSEPESVLHDDSTSR